MHHHLDKKEIHEGKFFAVISYLSFLCIAALLLKKHNKFALYHAKQGLALFVLEVACLIISIIPFLGWLIKIFGFTLFILISLWGIIQALLGNYSRIPLISKISDNIVL